MNDSTDDVDDRIGALGHVRMSAGAHDATQALTTLFEDPEVRTAIEPARRRRFKEFSRRHRLIVGSLIAVVSLGVGVPAVATSILARTGEFGDPSTSTEVDETEWIDPGAEGVAQVVIDAYPEYVELPPGMPKNAAIADTSRLLPGSGTEQPAGKALVQEGFATQLYETFGICAWTDVWLTAQASSDPDDEALATAWLSDAENYPRFSTDQSIKDRMADIAAAASHGDTATMKDAYTEFDCAVRLEGTK
ncbi:hypothetical protein [Cryobacterium sp. TMT3-29-2]|uniref:hypothetical protein n=1 Tax=Cryobacterium sp. TMT3-29-2 TaxID=2555867 RepID=UPI0010741638|nr:hypothetical protein [Cryobacterium sp. TMT3-29-2]TFC88974.1 hypothetical protein E3O67_07360 [Cryobacterium sp. TMT3-29-2]